jgi:serpin B
MKHLLIISIVILARISCYAQNNNTSIADSNNHFAFKLYNEVKSEKPEQNLFFSPFSISTALAMTYAGARGETEKQMSQTLCFSLEQNTFHDDFSKLIEDIEKDTTNGTQLAIANSLWAQKNYKFLDTFFSLVKAHYDAILKNVDFTNYSEREKARKELNSWVEQKTNDKIKELVKEKDIDDATRLILVNAIYFKDVWENPFEASETKEKPFYFNDNDTIHTLMMQKTEAINYYSNSDMQVVEIPYKDDKLSMLVFLPNYYDGIGAMEKSLNNGLYSQVLSSLKRERVELSLPKFKTSFNIYLEKTLAVMGMPIAFSGNADFSGMTGRKDLEISKVIHQAFINVDESGTEAAAATAVIMGMMAMRSDNNNKIIFNANHPFIFLIKDNATGSILFMGKIMNPKVN